ncbi:MAG: DNA-3-methyladenine glycosylase family protein [Microbacterium sp.]
MSFAASQGGEDAAAVNFAFTLDRSWQPVGVRVTEQGDTFVAEVVTNPGEASDDEIRRNLVRILNLHVDGDPLEQVGARDQIVEHLRERYSGLRPVQFPTPWEAAAWAVIGHRIRITHAAAIKQRLSARFGHRTEFPGGQVLDSFPSPGVVLSLSAMPGLTVRKFDTLQGIAHAAVDGALDTERLLNLPHTEASAELQTLYGIGPFSAELILVRGVGVADLFPTSEPRLAKAMTALYCTENPDEHLRIAEQWRPYRSWVALLIRRWLEDETGEIARGIPAAAIPTPDFAQHRR